MTVEEIFHEVLTHMRKGIMMHEELSDYYDFLCLEGYSRCHEYRYYDEACNYKKTLKYYLEHKNKLIPRIDIEVPKIIPDSWYNYKRDDVDMKTKRNAVIKGLDTWITWEKETKDLYEKMYKELEELDDIACTRVLYNLVVDVDHELKKAEHYRLVKMATDYDMVSIMEEQKPKKNKYKHKIEELDGH